MRAVYRGCAAWSCRAGAHLSQVIFLAVLLTICQLHHDVITSVGSWEYKIPSAYDIPLEFNVALLKDSPNPVGVKGSKASAEPGMTLVASTYLAVKEAIYAARAGESTACFVLLQLRFNTCSD